MKQLMQAELIFDDADARGRAVVLLTEQGYEIELLDWEDRHEGVLLSATTWLQVRGPYEGSEDEFFNEMGHLAGQCNGDVLEAGLQFPPIAERLDEQSGDDNNPFPFKAS